MKHTTSSDFWSRYNRLPVEAQEVANKNYELLKANPRHPSLHLKKIDEVWSIRVGLHYRALGIDAVDGIQWFWIGAHAEYDQFFA